MAITDFHSFLFVILSMDSQRSVMVRTWTCTPTPPSIGAIPSCSDFFARTHRRVESKRALSPASPRGRILVPCHHHHPAAQVDRKPLPLYKTLSTRAPILTSRNFISRTRRVFLIEATLLKTRSSRGPGASTYSLWH